MMVHWHDDSRAGMDSIFERGKAYVGTCCLDPKQPKKVYVIAGRSTEREGIVVTFARIGTDTVREYIEDFDGREIAIVRDPCGLDYSLSSTCEADVNRALEVVDMMRR